MSGSCTRTLKYKMSLIDFCQLFFLKTLSTAHMSQLHPQKLLLVHATPPPQPLQPPVIEMRCASRVCLAETQEHLRSKQSQGGNLREFFFFQTVSC